MTGQELASLVKDGVHPVVTFTKEIHQQECYMEPGMRGRLTRVITEESEYISLQVDLTEFDAFNRAFEGSNYFDKHGVARLTAREAGKYKPLESVYVVPADEVDVLAIDIPEVLDLHERFKRSGSTVTYVQWLENHVLALETRLATKTEASEASSQGVKADAVAHASADAMADTTAEATA